MIEILIGTGAAVAPLLWGVARALLGRSRRWHERRLRRIPRVPIADAPEGRTIFLVGHLVGLPPHEAPFTGRRCYYWSVEVRLLDEEGGVRARESSRAATLTLEDDTGRALVDTAGAMVTSDRATSLRVLPGSANPRAAAELMARHGLHPSPTVAFQYVFCEIALGPNDPVAVVGHGTREPDRQVGHAERGYRDAPPMILHLSGTRRDPIFLSDDPLVITPDIDEGRRP